MKRAAVFFLAILVVTSFNPVYSGSRHPGLAPDDRSALPGSTTPSPHSTQPPTVQPRSSVPPIPNTPYTAPQGPVNTKLENLRNNYSRDLKKLDEQYRAHQDKSFKAPIGSQQRKDLQQQMDSITKQKTALNDKFNKEYNQILGSQTPSPPSTPPPAKPTPAPVPHSPVAGSGPNQPKSMAEFFDQKLRELGGPGLDKRTKDLLQLGDNITDVWKALDKKQAEMLNNPSLTAKQKYDIEKEIRQERRKLAEIYDAALHGRTPAPAKWAPQPGDPVFKEPPQAKPQEPSRLPNYAPIPTAIQDWVNGLIGKIAPPPPRISCPGEAGPRSPSAAGPSTQLEPVNSQKEEQHQGGGGKSSDLVKGVKGWATDIAFGDPNMASPFAATNNWLQNHGVPTDKINEWGSAPKYTDAFLGPDLMPGAAAIIPSGSGRLLKIPAAPIIWSVSTVEDLARSTASALTARTDVEYKQGFWNIIGVIPRSIPGFLEAWAGQ